MASTHSYVIFSAQYLPTVGGVENFTASLASELASEGHRVTVVASEHPDACDREDTNGFEVVRLPAYRLLDGRLPISHHSAAYERIWDYLLGLPCDRVLVNTRFYPHSLEGLRYAEEKGAQALVLEHGSAPLTMGNPLMNKAISGYEHIITKLGARYNPRYAGVSLAACRWLKEAFGITTTRVVSNAIDAPAFRAASSGWDFRALIPEGGSQFVAAFIARFIAEKGVLVTLEAAERMPEVTFMFAGSGPLDDEVKARCAELPNCIYVGQLQKPDVSALLSQSDVWVSPTVSEGGLPTSLLEAGAWGTLPVMTNVGSIETLLGQDGGSAELCTLEASSVQAALERLAALSPEDRQARSGEFRHRVETAFTWADSARALDKAFE